MLKTNGVLVCAGAMLAVCTLMDVARGETLAFKGGTCTDNGKGAYFIDVGGRKLNVEAAWIDPRWGQTVIRDGLKASVVGEVLRLTLDATATKGQDLNREHPMMVRLSGNATA